MIRVLRLIEYTYPDAQSADEDMSHWKAPAMGSYSFRKDWMVRSTIMLDLNFEGTDPVGSEIDYDPNDPLLVRNDKNVICGMATGWNPHGVGECIVQFFDGSADSCMFNELNWANGSLDARLALNAKER